MAKDTSSQIESARVPLKYRLQTKLALALVVTGLIPFVIYASYTFQTLRDLVAETSQSILTATTRDYVDRTDTWVRRGLDHVGLAARMPVFGDAVANQYSPTADWDPLEEDMESLSRRAPVFIRCVALFDLQGEKVLEWPDRAHSLEARESQWFRVPLLTAEPTFQLALQESEAGQLVYSAPLIRGNEPVGVLRIGYHLAALEHLLSLLTEVSRGPSFVAIIADDGTLLASDLPAGIEASAGWVVGQQVPLPRIVEELKTKKVERIFELEFPYMGSRLWTACLHPLEETPWHVAYFLPSEQYLAPMRGRIAIALVIAGVLVFLLVATGFASAQVLSRNLQTLTRAAQTIAAGDLDIRVSEKSRDEIGLLAKSFNLMAHSLSQRTQALIEARHQAEAASRAKSDFLSVMSHEVRTPLNAVIGYSDLLINNPDLAEEHRASVKSIRRSGSDLLGMLNNMLDFTKLEAGKVEAEMAPFAVLELFSDIIEHTAAEAARKGLEIILEPVGEVPELLVSDGPKIRQILLNLLFNALKFTREGGVRIYFEVDFKPDRQSGDFLIMIEDTGIGITPEVRRRLFKPFSQGDPSITRKYGGTGLGLVISQYMARACGGELTECSPLKGGGSFALSIPVRHAGDQYLPKPQLHPTLRGSKVWVLSRNHVSGTCIQKQLSNAGLRCMTKPSGRLDALVIDEPSLNGAEIMRDLERCAHQLENVPVLQLHAHTASPMKLPFPARRLVLSKPVLPHELVSQMNALLSAENFVNHQNVDP